VFAGEKNSEPMPFALTISGGISLGSYEAGLNWALVEYMKNPLQADLSQDDNRPKNWKPELLSITGASAGSINAVMTAMNWCVDPAKRKLLQEIGIERKIVVDGNLIRDIWVDVGIDALFPKDPDQYVNPGQSGLVDGLFARSAFDASIGKMETMLGLNLYKPGCRVPVAMLTTREEAAELKVGKVIVHNQRFVFSLQFVADENGNGHFENFILNDADGTLGNVVYLPAPHRQIPFTDLKRLIYASSAFPVAFGQVELNYCTGNERGRINTQVCPDGTYLKSTNFVDGGVFDNIPLGTAAGVMAEKLKSDRNIKGKRYFFFISPTTRRNVATSGMYPLQKQSSTFGLIGLLSYLPGAINTSTDYELYSVLKNRQKWSADLEAETPPLKIIPTSRYFPITGSYLGHFGAFLDKPFREFDYYTGVYDAVSNLAEISCIKKGRTLESQDLCAGGTAKRIFDSLDIAGSFQARTVFTLIAAQEHADYKIPGTPWSWIADNLPEPGQDHGDVEKVLRSLREASGIPKDGDDTESMFKEFINRLHANNYVGKSELMQQIMKKHDHDITTWYASMVGRAGNRLQKLQSYESDKTGNTSLRFGTTLLTLGAGKYFGYNDAMTLGPSSESRVDTVYKLIPYELSGDFVNGGFSVSYLPRIRGRQTSLDLKLTPIGNNKFGRERIWFSQADLYLSYHPGKLLSYGIGPTLNYTWERAADYSRTNFGVAAYAEIYRFVRFTAGLRSLGELRHSRNNFYVSVGITDLPGTISRIVRSW
jgi:predicted acylesterase/phospholipase RssA